MAIHCFDVVYSPSSGMDSYLESWLTGWSAWSEETLDESSSMTLTDVESGLSVSASGFTQNRLSELQEKLDDEE